MESPEGLVNDLFQACKHEEWSNALAYFELIEAEKDAADWKLLLSSTQYSGVQYTLLHWVAYHGNEELCQLLLQYQVHVNVVSKDLTTPFQLAVEQRHLRIALLLLQHGASWDTRDNKEIGPFHHTSWIKMTYPTSIADYHTKIANSILHCQELRTKATKADAELTQLLQDTRTAHALAYEKETQYQNNLIQRLHLDRSNQKLQKRIHELEALVYNEEQSKKQLLSRQETAEKQYQDNLNSLEHEKSSSSATQQTIQRNHVTLKQTQEQLAFLQHRVSVRCELLDAVQTLEKNEPFQEQALHHLLQISAAKDGCQTLIYNGLLHYLIQLLITYQHNYVILHDGCLILMNLFAQEQLEFPMNDQVQSIWMGIRNYFEQYPTHLYLPTPEEVDCRLTHLQSLSLGLLRLMITQCQQVKHSLLQENISEWTRNIAEQLATLQATHEHFDTHESYESAATGVSGTMNEPEDDDLRLKETERDLERETRSLE